ncbi:hypothetical protein [Spirosoma foliorum]|uniref:Uncharacterized protein n=1 Tax=Spirosoma foliorum TaxID=2710596 RepID=A0A7G5H2F8_9BACT|nr:hypothetical protein [Spirosoma foliorum]QMW05300.1 hypothetical protein H3H32_10645 [Spirosoma foliorum]
MKNAEEILESIWDDAMKRIAKDRDPIKTYYAYFVPATRVWHIAPVMKGPKGSRCLSVLRCEITTEALHWPEPYPIVGSVGVASDKKRIKVIEVTPFKNRDYYTILKSGK